MSTNEDRPEQLPSLEHFNCNVMVVNKTRSVIRLNGEPKSKHGKYKPAPPHEIAPGRAGSFVLKHTKGSLHGTKGSCGYICAGRNAPALVELSYSCPSGDGLNAADAVVEVGQGVSVQMIPNPLPQSGHPVNVQFNIE